MRRRTQLLVIGGPLVLAGLWMARQFVPSAPDRSAQPTTAGTPPAAPPPPAPGPAVSGPDAPVLIQFRLSNAYPAAELPLVEAALSVLPQREVQVDRALGLSDLLRQEFRLSAATKPDVARLLEDRIRASSGLAPEQDLIEPGTVRVPQLSAYSSAANDLMASITVPFGSDRLSASLPMLANGQPVTPRTPAPLQPAFTAYVVRAKARDLSEEALRQLAASASATVLARQFDVQLAPAIVGALTPSYALPQSAQIQQALSTGQRDVTLFVLDTGWPDAAARTESLAALEKLTVGARAWYRFPAATVPLSRVGAFTDPLDPHVAQIQTALQPLVALSSHVKVIYVPMTLDQEARPVLEELVRLGLAIESWGFPSAQPQPSQGQTAYKAVSDQDVNDALSTISHHADHGKFAVNTAVLSGLFLLARRAAGSSGDGYFVNESWTTEDAGMLVRPVRAEGGFVVAAVGNDEQRNVVTQPLAFAGLSAENKPILAVMSMDDRGALDCRSSQVTFAGVDLGAVGYSGRLTPTECGSSFAAPRVAWFLAARDTLRTANVSSPTPWVLDIRARLDALRPANGPLPQSLLFDPVKYIR